MVVIAHVHRHGCAALLVAVPHVHRHGCAALLVVITHVHRHGCAALLVVITHVHRHGCAALLVAVAHVHRHGCAALLVAVPHVHRHGCAALLVAIAHVHRHGCAAAHIHAFHGAPSFGETPSVFLRQFEHRVGNRIGKHKFSGFRQEALISVLRNVVRRFAEGLRRKRHHQDPCADNDDNRQTQPDSPNHRSSSFVVRRRVRRPWRNPNQPMDRSSPPRPSGR